MKKRTKEDAAVQGYAFDKQHIWLYFLLVVAMPIVTHHILQFFYVGFERKLRDTLYTETGETVFSMLLGCFSVLINFLKSIAVFVVVGLLAVRMVRAYRSRLTKIGVIALPFALLIPYLASYWLGAVFQNLNSLTAGYLTVNIVANWLLDMAIVGLCVLVIVTRRAKIWKREELDPKDEWLPRKSNPCLKTALYLTLTSFAVRLVVCMVTTISDVVNAGAPDGFSEVVELFYPYFLLTAQHLVGYLILAQIMRAAQRLQPVQEKPFSRPWMVKKK